MGDPLGESVASFRRLPSAAAPSRWCCPNRPRQALETALLIDEAAEGASDARRRPPAAYGAAPSPKPDFLRFSAQIALNSGA